MISAFVAMNRATKENGCLQVLRGSHHCVGEQTGADPTRIKEIESLLEHVYVEMEPGSVLFFHSNTLHCSSANNSDKHRRSFIMCYNALANPQLNGKNNCSRVSCPVGSDDGILNFAERELQTA